MFVFSSNKQNLPNVPNVVKQLGYVSNTGKSVSSGYPNTKKWVEKTEAQPSFFNQLRDVWIPDETLFQVFDIASQIMYNSWRDSKQKFAKLYAY